MVWSRPELNRRPPECDSGALPSELLPLNDYFIIKSLSKKPISAKIDSKMDRIIHFGAGNIGRGFFGQLYYESGYHTVFVDIVDRVIDTLNEKKEYPLWLVAEKTEKLTIKNVSGIRIGEIKKNCRFLNDC